MKIYLQRHGEAWEGPRDDPTRGLTTIGREQTEMMGTWLVRQIGRVDVIFTSDFERARHTAKIMAEALGCDNVVTTGELEPDCKPEGMWKAIQAAPKDAEHVLVVGHYPSIRFLAEHLCAAKTDDLSFKHSAIAHIDVDAKTLRWLVAPKLVERDEQQQDVLEAAERLVDAVEDAVFGESLKHPKHMSIIDPITRRTKALVGAYFADQQAQLLEDLKPKIAKLYEAAGDEEDDDEEDDLPPEEKKKKALLLAAALLAGPSAWRLAPNDEQITAWATEIAAALKGAWAQFTGELGTPSTIPEDVIAKYLRDKSLGKLTGEWSETTLDRLRNGLADAWTENATYDQMIQRIKDVYEGFSDMRAEMIANTEIASAYNTARREAAHAMGMEEKAWICEGPDPCEVCLDNEAEEWIDIDDVWGSGSDDAPEHPNCLCSVEYRQIEDAE